MAALLSTPTFTTEMQPLPLGEGFEEEVNTALDKVMSLSHARPTSLAQTWVGSLAC